MNPRRLQQIGMSAAGIALAWSVPPPLTMAQATQPDADALQQHLTVKGLEFNFMPAVWIPRVSGQSALGPSSTATELDNRNDLQLNNSEPAFSIDFSVRKDETWQIMAGGFGYSNDSHGTFDGSADFGSLTLDAGDAFSSSFEMSSFYLQAGHWFNVEVGPGYTHLMMAPVAGVRYVSVDLDVTQTGIGSADGDGDWACPYLGGELEVRWDCKDVLKFIDQVQISGGGGFGLAVGGDGGWMGQMHAELTLMFTRNLGAFFGYRLLEMDAENDDFDFSGGVEGLYFGGVLRF